jgi:hypothetical protein
VRQIEYQGREGLVYFRVVGEGLFDEMTFKAGHCDSHL